MDFNIYVKKGAMSTTRLPGDVGPEHPVVRGYSTTTRSSSNPVVHRGPPKRTHTYSNEQRASYQAPTVVQKEPDKPSASNLYEDHMKKRQFVPREQKKEIYEPVDYMKQFQEEEEKIKEDERRAKEDLERKLREEEEAEQRQREMEEKKRREMEEEERKRKETEARKNPKHARALYNFTPQTSKEIGFRKGDIVLFYRSIDSNWCEGEAQGQIGLYPLSYVEIIEESAPKIKGEGRVKYNFKAESARELHLQKGDIVALIRQIDENWFEGVKDNKVGIFPVSYIEVLRNPEEKPASPNVVKEEVVKKPNGYSKVESSFDDFPEPLNTEPDIRDLKGENFIVLFPYEPQNEDELELLEGDIVKVVEKCDDGWFVGISERTGDFGTFPGNYVKLV
ncbi:sorbin and SH3 domain-containing protein 2-like isoform X3 [Xenia sp. Carnegie-2017]|uniref:sorbin and SH3 domain-containing protein 2-like isoform X3 n=1 Tax=Xenia sp. Carnegie-2017 TaxID=2897299 RepID=UPI001F03AE20|nr:sorbin and SH3 domain-containing protein 2-like isoform X3 [Xenia sp. Carnegie-2017]